MNSIDFETLIVIIFVLVDDWYQLEGKAFRGKVPGAKAIMCDSEILTLALMMDYLPFPGETQFIGFIRANYGSWFPHLLGRVRQRIEGVFHEIQNTGRNPERLLNKTIEGFTTHIAAKITSHTLRLLLRSQFSIDVLTFQSISN